MSEFKTGDNVDEVKNTFTKADLKDGMVVTNRRGDERIVIGKTLHQSNGSFDYHWVGGLGTFEDNLLVKHSTGHSGLDIVKVSYMGKTLWERKREFKVGDKVKHFKGGVYQILNFAKHTETGEEMVVYQSVTNSKFHVRPKEMFMSEVDHEKYPDVKQKYRMELCER